MSLRLADRWIWDFWLARDGDDMHVFFLQAPRSLGEPDLRHENATIGHARSRDLRDWTLLPDALGRGAPGAFDDLATWTGSVIRHADRWILFYSGIRTGQSRIQRIGSATSDDLVTWRRSGVVIEADARWYQKAGPEGSEDWRDPWAFVHEDGDVHLLITATAADGPAGARGVIGHAWSADLETWSVGPPISEAGWYRQLEVPELLQIDGRWLVLFSTGPGDHAPPRATDSGFVAAGGSHLLEGPGPLGPFRPVSGPMLVGDRRTSLYAGRMIEWGGGWQFLAWRGHASGGVFLGELADPMPVRIDVRGRLVVDVPPGMLETT